MSAIVSVICVCYNHEPFVIEALESVKAQTYTNIEIVIVDDGSNDNSVELIENWVKQNPNAKFLNLKTNQGYCKAFNKALKEVTGDYIIDFATDDLMTPTKIEEQVNFFSNLDVDYGVVFTDADYINKDGKYLRSHFSYLLKKGLIKNIPQGDVYAHVLSTYFVPSPTMMVRALVYKTLNGYDEDLAYEDFDFWIRSSRNFKYAYLPKPLMKIRRNIKSMSSGWYKQGDRQLHSTYLVCRKALQLNRSNDEKNALRKRVEYELRQSVFSENKNEANLFYNLLQDMGALNFISRITYFVGQLGFPLSPMRKLYHSVRYELFN
jgi:glycosyltransferase involved in cell wall biosynthesis